jgi:hypothetical protein
VEERLGASKIRVGEASLAAGAARQGSCGLCENGLGFRPGHLTARPALWLSRPGGDGRMAAIEIGSEVVVTQIDEIRVQ